MFREISRENWRDTNRKEDDSSSNLKTKEYILLF